MSQSTERVREYNRKYYQANKERFRSEQKEYYDLNKEKYAEYRRRQREKYLADPAIKRKYHLKYEYGLTLEDYHQRYSEQNGQCLICESPQELLDVDHDHTTGKVRGLLCNQCNTALGLLKDSPDVLLKAVAYLRR